MRKDDKAESQREITAATDLLDEKGNLAAPGFCRENLYRYDRASIAANAMRLKEWEFYQISDGRHMAVLNFFNIGWCACFTAELCDLKTGTTCSDMILYAVTAGKFPLSGSADEDFSLVIEKNGKRGSFQTKDGVRKLEYTGKAKGKPFSIRLTGRAPKEQDSLTVATPFKKGGQFFLTQKVNCIPTEGFAVCGGKRVEFSAEKTYMVMDWARGVWPWRSYWYWSNGSTRLPDGRLFGFELTWGFGDTSAAEETALFYDGKCHKLGKVELERDPEKHGWMKPWHFVEENGRLDITLTPEFDHRSGFVFCGLLGMKSHQLHGRMDGWAVLDDGTRVEIRDMYAFAEKVKNRW